MMETGMCDNDGDDGDSGDDGHASITQGARSPSSFSCRSGRLPSRPQPPPSQIPSGGGGGARAQPHPSQIPFGGGGGARAQPPPDLALQ